MKSRPSIRNYAMLFRSACCKSKSIRLCGEAGALPAGASLSETVTEFERRTILNRLVRLDRLAGRVRGCLAQAAFSFESGDYEAEHRDSEEVATERGA